MGFGSFGVRLSGTGCSGGVGDLRVRKSLNGFRGFRV